jgi:hypothetical protein
VIPLSSSIRVPWRTHGSTPETSSPAPTLPLLPHCQQGQPDEMPPFLPNSSSVLVSEEGLIGSGGSEDKMSQCPIPHESPKSYKGTCTFRSHSPLEMPQNCHEADNQKAFAGLCICPCRDMLTDHSTPDSPPQQK